MTFDRFVGLPYRDKGRATDGVDCWGLLHLVYAAHGIAVPSYAERYDSADDRRGIAALIAGELAPWSEQLAGQEQCLDAVLMTEGRFARHVGVVVTPGKVLHITAGTTSQIERYRGGPLRLSVVGFYRLRAE